MPHTTGRPLDHLRLATSLKLFLLPGSSQVKMLETNSLLGPFTFYCEEMSLGGKDDHHIAMINSEFVGSAAKSKLEDSLEILYFENLITDKTIIKDKDINHDLYDTNIMVLPFEITFLNNENIIHLREGKDEFYCDTLEVSLRIA